MEQFDEIGRYIQSRLRERKITDPDVASLLNLSQKSVQKIYPLKDMYSGRLSKFCILLGENIFEDFYGNKEPLKTVLHKKNDLLHSEIDELRMKIKALEDTVSKQDKLIQTFQDDIMPVLKEILSKVNEK